LQWSGHGIREQPVRVIRNRLKAIRRDDGFTLVELVVTVAILGIIVAVLCGVVLQYLKTSGTTSARLTESTDQQFVSAYWQADVSSLGRRAYDASNSSNPLSSQQSVFVGSAGPNGCGSGVGSFVAVTFAWTEFEANGPDNAWDSTTHEVAYVTFDPPPSGAPFVLKRVRCRNGVAGQPLNVAHNLTRRPEITCDTACSAATPPNRVTMKITVKDPTQPNSPGYTTTVTADRRQG
jgi:prepilin-type N-terminal cleavage/methylation domain-containing protein